jgi:hypothetical protein
MELFWEFLFFAIKVCCYNEIEFFQWILVKNNSGILGGKETYLHVSIMLQISDLLVQL